MKFYRILPALIFSILIISSSFAQQENMMKKDDMNKNMKMENKEMKSDSVMMTKDNIEKGMKKDMKDNMDMSRDKMKSNNMMKSDNMMKKGMMSKIYKDRNNVAINGYDPVAYFTDSKSVMGDKKYSFKWNGAEWYFSVKSHMEMFKKNPGKYTPQYGGFCAFGVTKNKLVSSDPNAWQIVNGKLYLCHTKEIHEMWKKDIKNNIKKGDEMFPKLNSNM